MDPSRASIYLDDTDTAKPPGPQPAIDEVEYAVLDAILAWADADARAAQS